MIRSIKNNGLTNFQLKMIALVTMVIGHLSLVFTGARGPNLSYLIVAGPIAFPLYAFLMAEGCRYTRNMKKYMVRLMGFAVFIQLSFYVVKFFLETYTNDTSLLNGLPVFNIFFTLLLGVVSIYCYIEINKMQELLLYKALAFVPAVIAMAAAQYFGADYGWKGLFIIFCLYIFNNKITQIIVTLLFIIFQYWDFITQYNYEMFISGKNAYFLMPFSALLCLAFIALYNGKLGRSWKWFFYLAYPGQYVLFGLMYLLLCM